MAHVRAATLGTTLRHVLVDSPVMREHIGSAVKTYPGTVMLLKRLSHSSEKYCSAIAQLAEAAQAFATDSSALLSELGAAGDIGSSTSVVDALQSLSSVDSRLRDLQASLEAGVISPLKSFRADVKRAIHLKKSCDESGQQFETRLRAILDDRKLAADFASEVETDLWRKQRVLEQMRLDLCTSVAFIEQQWIPKYETSLGNMLLHAVEAHSRCFGADCVPAKLLTLAKAAAVESVQNVSRLLEQKEALTKLLEERHAKPSRQSDALLASETEDDDDREQCAQAASTKIIDLCSGPASQRNFNNGSWLYLREASGTAHRKIWSRRCCAYRRVASFCRRRV